MDLYKQTKMHLARKPIRFAILAMAVIAILAIIYSLGASEAEEVAEVSLPVVTVTTATQYAGNSTVNLIGTVRAFSEAVVTTETAGRVTGVRVGLGDSVAAGQIIATIENASQQASVLQAEGSYDAALASLEQSQFGNAQSQVGVAEAETRLNVAQNSAVSISKTAYSTVEGIIYNNIDQFFTNPDGQVPGVRLQGRGFTQELNNTRVAYQTDLPVWKQRSTVVSNTSDLDAELVYTSQQVSEALNYVNIFITVLQGQDSGDRYSTTELATFAATFNSLRNSLIQLQSQIDSAQNGLTSAREGIERATITVTGSTNSAANAQVKQALGSLRAAQANLAKTIIRTPISGTVNSLDIRTGDFVNSFAQVALVANNNALEIITFIGENDREVFAIGDTVTLDGQYDGTVTRIAPAVNAGTGKTEVRIASESQDLQNGDSVRVNKEVAGDTISQVIIPLSAVKFALNDGSVFVIEDNKLVERPVTLGTVRGGSVEILDGLSITDEFVADARGLVAATEVEVIR